MSVHVGASVLVFGYLGYLLVRGVLERSFWSIAGSLAVFLLYGGALFGILPGEAGISWQGHLFGLLGGVLAARVLAKKSEQDSKKRVASESRSRPRVAPSLGAGSRVSTKVAAADDDEELEALRRRVGR